MCFEKQRGGYTTIGPSPNLEKINYRWFRIFIAWCLRTEIKWIIQYHIFSKNNLLWFAVEKCIWHQIREDKQICIIFKTEIYFKPWKINTNVLHILIHTIFVSLNIRLFLLMAWIVYENTDRGSLNCCPFLSLVN